MRSFLPSRLELPNNHRAIQLQFIGAGFEMSFFENGHPVTRPLSVTAGQLRQVSIDLRPVEIQPLKLLYQDRCVVMELSDRIWARVPDVEFMRLLDLAVDGQGQGIDLTK
ncbi:MAG: hypothetical protein QOJ65_911 [Fimbriimonadaceae bacterium]|jgi:hypothetical protein|nr:hypothetical protein [Fimbriimonadaceae bacterium]